MCRMSTMLLGIALTPLAGPTQADKVSPLDRLSFGVGQFANRLNIDGRVDGSTEVQGSPRDFDEQFDFDNRQAINLWELSWRPWDHHQFDLRRYRDARSRSASLSEQLTFDGEVFPVQAEVRGSAEFTITELTYTGWFRVDKPSPVGLQLGALRLHGRLALSGRILIDGVGEAEGGASVQEHVYAPLLGVAWRHAYNDAWRSFAELRLIRLNINAVKGDALSGRFGVEYFPTTHLGIALQYGGARLHAEQQKDDFSGDLEVGFRGPQLLLRLRY